MIHYENWSGIRRPNYLQGHFKVYTQTHNIKASLYKASASTQSCRCSDTSDTALIEMYFLKNGLQSYSVKILFVTLDFNKTDIAGVIAALSLCWRWLME